MKHKVWPQIVPASYIYCAKENSKNKWARKPLNGDFIILIMISTSGFDVKRWKWSCKNLFLCETYVLLQRSLSYVECSIIQLNFGGIKGWISSTLSWKKGVFFYYYFNFNKNLSVNETFLNKKMSPKQSACFKLAYFVGNSGSLKSKTIFFFMVKWPNTDIYFSLNLYSIYTG